MAFTSKHNDAFTHTDPELLSRLLIALHEVSFELANSTSVDDLCRKAVNLGMEELGFERLGIWFFDPLDPGWLVGTFGVDESGTIRDERSSRVRLDEEVMPRHFFEDQVPYLLFNERTVFNHRHEPVGTADIAVAPIWNGRTSMGSIAADNLLRHSGMDEAHCHVLALLARSVGHLATLKQTEAQLRESQGRLELLASRDGLTGVLNRRTGLEMLEQQMSRARRSGEKLSICFVDLDGLKWVNDNWGHQVGDQFLRNLVALFEQRLRESDVICRMGGDEFMIILPDSDAEQAEKVMKHIVERSQIAPELGRLKEPPFFSYGIAEREDNELSAEELLLRADQLMYTQKRKHKG